MNTEEKIKKLESMAKRMRLRALKMAYIAGTRGAHIGGSLSSIEVFAVLYGEILNYDRDNPFWDDRDRLIVGKEHGRLSEYPALVEAGLIKEDDLDHYLDDGGLLAGHVRNVKIGLEYSACSLGMALPIAVGIALAAKMKQKKYRVFTIVGDGECDEGSVWEGFMAAAHYQLDNLIAVIDRNGLSCDGDTECVMALGDLKGKLISFGWNVIEIQNGNDIGQCLETFENIHQRNKPIAIIAHTVKGKGVSFIENRLEWHRAVLTEEQYKQAMREIGGC